MTISRELAYLSTVVDVRELNCRVRNGSGWNLSAMAAISPKPSSRLEREYSCSAGSRVATPPTWHRLQHVCSGVQVSYETCTILFVVTCLYGYAKVICIWMTSGISETSSERTRIMIREAHIVPDSTHHIEHHLSS